MRFVKGLANSKYTYAPNMIHICPNRSIEDYKAHLVEKSFTQEYEIDYEETFALVTRISSIRALLSVAATNK